jgi:hypothetical protein
MKRQLILAVVAFAWIVPATAHAQTRSRPSVVRPTPVPGQAAPVGTRTVVGTVETRVTKDRPYSAEAVNETVQVLADGNRIARRSVTKIYRDSAGRTRRETLNGDGTVRSISISDPVAGTGYTLNPQAKTGNKTGGMVVAMPMPAGGSYTVTRPRQTPPAGTASGSGRAGGRGSGTGAGTGAGTGTAVGGFASVARGGGGGGRGGVVTSASSRGVRETLDLQNIEGVMATGTRTTTTIPAGEIGNAQEIKVVSEQWFSDELQVLVMTKHSDPRSGETIYRLTNILRAEPDPSLFTVPADYTIQERRR